MWRGCVPDLLALLKPRCCQMLRVSLYWGHLPWRYCLPADLHLQPVSHDWASHNLCTIACLQMAISAKAAYAAQPVTTTAGHRTATTMRSAGGGGGRRRGKSPPDLPSMLLDSRICFIGMPVGWWYLPLCVLQQQCCSPMQARPLFYLGIWTSCQEQAWHSPSCWL